MCIYTTGLSTNTIYWQVLGNGIKYVLLFQHHTANYLNLLFTWKDQHMGKYIKFIIMTNICILIYECNFYDTVITDMFHSPCGHLQGSENKNTDTIIMYEYHYTVNNCIKGKGKGRLWVLQHCCLQAYCTLTRMSSVIHLQRRCTHQAAWETSASEGRNYTWNLASNP